MICLQLLTPFIWLPWVWTMVKAGTAKLARIAMIVITTNNSIRVKAWFRFVFIGGMFLVGYDVMRPPN